MNYDLHIRLHELKLMGSLLELLETIGATIVSLTPTNEVAATHNVKPTPRSKHSRQVKTIGPLPNAVVMALSILGADQSHHCTKIAAAILPYGYQPTGVGPALTAASRNGHVTSTANGYWCLTEKGRTYALSLAEHTDKQDASKPAA